MSSSSSPPTDPVRDPSTSALGRVWRFDDFVLDTARYELRRDGDVIRVEPQVFDVMTHLVSNHERFVTKEELFGTIDTPVAPAAVTPEPAPPPRQHIAFCRAADGVRLAYAVAGDGPPLVRAANWMTHLGYDIESPVWRHWVRDLTARHTFVRYDERGCGLSDWEAFDHLQRRTTSPENAVRFLEEFARIDVRDLAQAVRCPTLIMHSRDDHRVPLRYGEELAALIKDSRLVTLASNNHLLTESEPAWRVFCDEVEAFTAS